MGLCRRSDGLGRMAFSGISGHSKSRSRATPGPSAESARGKIGCGFTLSLCGLPLGVAVNELVGVRAGQYRELDQFLHHVDDPVIIT